MWKARAFGGVLAVAALVGSPVAAADNGIRVDPGSPAGKEYVLPLDAARSQAAVGSDSVRGAGTAAGGSGSNASSTGASPLFGQGIVVSGGAATRHHHHAGAATPAANAAIAQPISPAVQRLVHADTSGSSEWALLGGAALVLVLGGATGFALRRRSS